MKHSYYLAAVVAVVACGRAFVLGGLLGAKSTEPPSATPPPLAMPPNRVADEPREPTRAPLRLQPDPIRCLQSAASGSVLLEVDEWGCFASDTNAIEVRWQAGRATRIVQAQQAPTRQEQTTVTAVRPFVAMIASLIDRDEGTPNCQSTNHVRAKLRWQCDNGPMQQVELSEDTGVRSSSQRVAGLRALLHAHLDERLPRVSSSRPRTRP